MDRKVIRSFPHTLCRVDIGFVLYYYNANLSKVDVVRKPYVYYISLFREKRDREASLFFFLPTCMKCMIQVLLWYDTFSNNVNTLS